MWGRCLFEAGACVRQAPILYFYCQPVRSVEKTFHNAYKLTQFHSLNNTKKFILCEMRVEFPVSLFMYPEFIIVYFICVSLIRPALVYRAIMQAYSLQ